MQEYNPKWVILLRWLRFNETYAKKRSSSHLLMSRLEYKAETQVQSRKLRDVRLFGLAEHVYDVHFKNFEHRET